MFFKSGYRYHEVRNLPLLEAAPLRTSSYWNGKQVPLKRFGGPLSEYSISLSGALLGRVEDFIRKRDCAWRAIPDFLWAIEKQNEEFVRARTPDNVRGLTYLGESFPS